MKRIVLQGVWFAGLALANDVLQEIHVARVYWKAIALAPGSFTEGRLVPLAESERRQGHGYRFKQVKFFGQKGAEPLTLGSSVMPIAEAPRDYQWWRTLHTSPPLAYEYAELIELEGKAVVRIHSFDGRVSRRLLTREDPLFMAIRGQRFELLYFQLFEALPAVHVYARTNSELDARTATTLVRRLEAAIPGVGIVLNVRRDPWFVYSLHYPLENPFLARILPPEESTWDHRTLRCSRRPVKVACIIERN
jgi:hypothetical protein